MATDLADGRCRQWLPPGDGRGGWQATAASSARSTAPSCGRATWPRNSLKLVAQDQQLEVLDLQATATADERSEQGPGRDAEERDGHPGDPSGPRPDEPRHANGALHGLGDEAQIHVELSATALCINPGGNHPKATNKTSVSAADDFPVQNGKADFTLSATATFQPECSPPMTVVFTDVTVTDTTNGLSHSFPGTF